MKSIVVILFLFLTMHVNAEQPPVPSAFVMPPEDAAFTSITTPSFLLEVSREAPIDNNNSRSYKIHRMVNINFGVPLQNPIAPGNEQSSKENQLAFDPEMTVYETKGSVLYPEGSKEAKEQIFNPVDCRLVAVNMMMANIDYEMRAFSNSKKEDDLLNTQATVKEDPNHKKSTAAFEKIDPRDDQFTQRESTQTKKSPQNRMVWFKRGLPMDHAIVASLFSKVIIKKSEIPEDSNIQWTEPEIITGLDGNEERAGGGILTIEFKPPWPGKKIVFNPTACKNYYGNKALDPDLCELTFQINACGLRYIQKSIALFNDEKCRENEVCHRGLADWINRWLPGERIFVNNGTTVSSIRAFQLKKAEPAATPVKPKSGFVPAVDVFRK